MFIPLNVIKTVNNAVIWDDRDNFRRFKRPARLLPETRPNAVLRYSSTTPTPALVASIRQEKAA